MHAGLETIGIELTPKAMARVSALVEKKQNPQLGLRVYISGGGCSGFQYGFKLDEHHPESDQVFLKTYQDKPVNLYVDQRSLVYLNGAVIDFIEGLQGSHFKISNPNASSTCGCGASFNVH